MSEKIVDYKDFHPGFFQPWIRTNCYFYGETKKVKWFHTQNEGWY